MHVRHGDKSIEMPLVPTEKYIEAAEHAVKMVSPLGYSRAAFISTEDPLAIEVAQNMSRDTADPYLRTWAFLWLDIPRENSNGDLQLEHLGMPRGQLARRFFLNLLLALECDAWVGTGYSNWNRLIDELRCIWVAKCQNIFVEVGMSAGYIHGWRL